MPKENKKTALTSPYLHIKYHEPWYLDTEIPDLDQHMGNLRRVLRILDKKTISSNLIKMNGWSKTSSSCC